MAKAKKGTEALYRYTMDCGRMGSVQGLFIATDAEVKAALGKDVYFGEVLGKHSDISGTLEEKEFERLTDDADFVAKFKKFDCASGHNPLERLSDSEDEETEDDGDDE
jgi:hypothetical protein